MGVIDSVTGDEPGPPLTVAESAARKESGLKAPRRRRGGTRSDADHSMPIIEDDARVVLARWQPILRLADWDIDLLLVTSAWRKSGDVKVDLDDRKAVLLLNAEPRSENLAETIVHELVHLRLYALDQMLVDLLDAVFGTVADEPRRAFAEARFMTLLESTTEDLAKALLATSGSPAPLSFGRLREEVEREIGPGTPAS